MGSTLKQNLCDSFYRRRNILTASPNRVTVLVEDSRDIPIWKRILENACPEKEFDIRPYQEGMNKSQSKKLVTTTIINKGGPHYIGCVDGDLDFVLTPSIFYPTNYLFHTYVYSIESLLCMPNTLDCAYTSATTFQATLDFEFLLTRVSRIIFPLIMTDLYLRSKGSHVVFNVEDWKYVFPGASRLKKALREERIQDIIPLVKSGIDKYLRKLERADSYNSEEFFSFQHSMIQFYPFFTPDNAILFAYGHGYYDFVLTLFDGLRQLDLGKALYAIRTDADMQPNVKIQRERALNNSQEPFATILHVNFEFLHNGNIFSQMMENDLQVL